MSHFFFSFKSSCKQSEISFSESQFDVGSSRHQLWKQYEFMINNTEQAVAGGHESRSWLCMLRPHGRGRRHIISCGHERACLFWIVQRITIPCALHLQPEIRCTSVLCIQITVTGCSCQCHHLRSWDHASDSHPTITTLAWVWECSAETLSNLKRRRKVASMRAKSRIRLCHWWHSTKV